MENLKTKKCYFYIDDVIWVFHDLTSLKPLNVFYRTDFYYGDDEFTLADMTDAYKAEWEAAADWLKLGFHSKQEFPDYPYVNASYEDVKNNFDAIKKEICRFAGLESFAYATVTRWLPMSKEGGQALRDGGIKIMTVSSGDKQPYNGDPFSLPYGMQDACCRIESRRPEYSAVVPVMWQSIVPSADIIICPMKPWIL